MWRPDFLGRQQGRSTGLKAWRKWRGPIQCQAIDTFLKSEQDMERFWWFKGGWSCGQELSLSDACSQFRRRYQLPFPTSRPVPLGRLSCISENQHLRWLARNDIETIRNPKGTLQTSIAVVERPSPRFMAWIHHHDVPQMQRSAAANDVWKPCSPMHLMSTTIE